MSSVMSAWTALALKHCRQSRTPSQDRSLAALIGAREAPLARGAAAPLAATSNLAARAHVPTITENVDVRKINNVKRLPVANEKVTLFYQTKTKKRHIAYTTTTHTTPPHISSLLHPPVPPSHLLLHPTNRIPTSLLLQGFINLFLPSILLSTTSQGV